MEQNKKEVLPRAVSEIESYVEGILKDQVLMMEFINEFGKDNFIQMQIFLVKQRYVSSDYKIKNNFKYFFGEKITQKQLTDNYLMYVSMISDAINKIMTAKFNTTLNELNYQNEA